MTHPLIPFIAKLDAAQPNEWLALFTDEIAAAKETDAPPASLHQMGNRYHLALYGITASGIHRWEAMQNWHKSAQFHPEIYTKPLQRIS